MRKVEIGFTSADQKLGLTQVTFLGTDTAETQPLPLQPHVEQPVPEKPLEDHYH